MTDSSDQALINAMLRESDPTRQSKLIEELGQRRSTAAVEPLIQQVRMNAFQSGAAITALGNIGDPRAVSVLIQSCRFQNLAWIAKDALVQIGPPAVEPLIAALENEQPDIRFMVVRALSELNDPRAIEPLERIVETEPDETNQQFARSTLKTLLLDSLTHPDAQIRLLAVRGLERLGDARTIDLLQTVADIDHEEAAVRRAAQAAVVRLLQGVETDPFEAHQLPSRSRNTNLLINKLQRVVGARMGTADSLAEETPTVAQLREIASTHSDDTARDLAQEALWLLCLDYVRHPDPNARLAAAQGLGWFNDPLADRILQQVAEYDPNEAVRQAAGEAGLH